MWDGDVEEIRELLGGEYGWRVAADSQSPSATARSGAEGVRRPLDGNATSTAAERRASGTSCVGAGARGDVHGGEMVGHGLLCCARRGMGRDRRRMAQRCCCALAERPRRCPLHAHSSITVLMRDEDCERFRAAAAADLPPDAPQRQWLGVVRRTPADIRAELDGVCFGDGCRVGTRIAPRKLLLPWFPTTT